MNTALIATLKALRNDPARVVELYAQLYAGTFIALVRQGSELSVGSMQFLAYPSSGGVSEVPVFTGSHCVLKGVLSDAIQVYLPGAVLWPRLLDVLEPGLQAAVDPGHPHGIRLPRDVVLGMIREYGVNEP